MGGVSHSWDPRCPYCTDATRKVTGREQPKEEKALDHAPPPEDKGAWERTNDPWSEDPQARQRERSEP